MEGEPKTIDKCFDKFAQWADWSEKDPVREIIFVICTHIIGLLFIVLSPIIAMIAAHSYTNAQREQEAKEDEELLEWWRREREEEYVKWVRGRKIKMRDMPIRPRRGAGDRVLPCNQDAIPGT